VNFWHIKQGYKNNTREHFFLLFFNPQIIMFCGVNFYGLCWLMWAHEVWMWSRKMWRAIFESRHKIFKFKITKDYYILMKFTSLSIFPASKSFLNNIPYLSDLFCYFQLFIPYFQPLFFHPKTSLSIITFFMPRFAAHSKKIML
jgi:hypothetical protein